MAGIRLDALVLDAGVGEQQGELHVGEVVEPLAVLRGHPVAGDDQHVVA